MQDRALTPSEVAKRLGISRQQVYTLIHSGKLTGRRVGLGIANIRVMESDLTAFLAASIIVAERLGTRQPALRPADSARRAEQLRLTKDYF